MPSFVLCGAPLPIKTRHWWYQLPIAFPYQSASFASQQYPFKCEQANPSLYLGNSAMAFLNVEFHREELGGDEIAARYQSADMPRAPPWTRTPIAVHRPPAGRGRLDAWGRVGFQIPAVANQSGRLRRMAAARLRERPLPPEGQGNYSSRAFDRNT